MVHGHGGKKRTMKIFLICTQHHVFYGCSQEYSARLEQIVNSYKVIFEKGRDGNHFGDWRRE